MKIKALLYIGILISIITYLFWELIPIKGFFYIGNALFIFIICLFIFINYKSAAAFLLFGFSLNNLLDELFFDNTKLEINELLTAIVIVLILVNKRNEYKI